MSRANRAKPVVLPHRTVSNADHVQLGDQPSRLKNCKVRAHLTVPASTVMMTLQKQANSQPYSGKPISCMMRTYRVMAT